MRTRLGQFTAFVSLAGILCAGCGKRPDSAPVPLPEEEIPSAVSAAFKGASKDTQETVQYYITDVKKHDFPSAFEEMQQLFQTPGLTDDQRALLARASMTTSQKVHEAAGNGDNNAAEVLRTFNANK